jgi:large subunit ribosomal protein L15
MQSKKPTQRVKAAVKKGVRSGEKPRTAVLRSKPSIPLREKTEDAPSLFGLHMVGAPTGAHRRRKIVGRGPGSGHGKTSTRGSKGQTSRSGRDFYPGFEGGQSPLIRRMPKRGFVNVSFSKEYQVVNLKQLVGMKVDTITPEVLHDRGMVKGHRRLVKILGAGELKQALVVKAHAFSKSAREKIAHAGGTTEVINV